MCKKEEYSITYAVNFINQVKKEKVMKTTTQIFAYDNKCACIVESNHSLMNSEWFFNLDHKDPQIVGSITKKRNAKLLDVQYKNITFRADSLISARNKLNELTGKTINSLLLFK